MSPVPSAIALAVVLSAALCLAVAQPLFSLDVAGSTDRPDLLSGSTKTTATSTVVTGTSTPAIYSSHRWGKEYRYTFPVPNAGVFDVVVHLAEIYIPNCGTGERIQDVIAFDPDAPNTAVENLFLDVFATVGCKVAFPLKLPQVRVGPSLKLVVLLRARKNFAMLSGLDVSVAGVTPSPSMGAPPQSMSPSPSVAGLPPVLELDAGGTTDRPDLVSGISSAFSRVDAISGTTSDALYSRHRWGADFSYVLPVPSGAYHVRVLLAEGYAKACFKGFRVFNIYAHDADRAQATGVSVLDIDVYDKVGCATAYQMLLGPIQVGLSGRLKVRFQGKNNNAMVSGLIVKAAESSGDGSSPSSSPSVPPATEMDVLNVDVGGATDIPSAISGWSKVFKGVLDVSGTNKDLLFSSNRYGNDFTYQVNVPPNAAYAVELFFAETYDPGCKNGFRVFDVTVFDANAGQAAGTVFSDVDVFKQAGCRTAYTLKVDSLLVGALGTIGIRLKASANNAMISGFRIVTVDTSSVSTSPPPLFASPSVSASASEQALPPSMSPSMSSSATVSAFISPSATASVSASATAQVESPTASSSASVALESPSASVSMSVSTYVSPSSAESISESQSASPSAILSVSASASPSVLASVSGSPLPSPSITESSSVSPPVTTSATASESVSPSASIVVSETPPPTATASPSVLPPSESPTVSVTASSSTSTSPSILASTSISPIVPSESPTALPSLSTSPTASSSSGSTPTQSISPSVTASTSVLATVSISPSMSMFAIPSESTSALPSPSMSVLSSESPSASPSVSEPPTTISPSATAFSSSVPPSESPSTSVMSTPSPVQPSPAGEVTTDQVVVDVGSGGDIYVDGTKKVFEAVSVSGTENVPGSNFRTAREGTNFEYVFNISPGAYDILLGFIELNDRENCLEPGKRVFNVFVNGQLQLGSFDIFSKAGCFNGIEEKITHSVSAILAEPLVIRFESIVGEARLSFLSIKPAQASCIPESVSGQISADHAAHSVPGSYPPQLSANSPKSYVDTVGDGFVTVRIDGSGSHTHFSDSQNGILGRVTKYTWTLVETGEIISNEVSFNYNFPLGTTRLKLSVIDNSCTTDEAETTVTVTGSVEPGQYCYYYSGMTELPVVGTLLEEPRPLFASVSQTLDLNFPSFAFSDTLFAARCFFFLEVDSAGETDVSISTDDTGMARVYKGVDLVVDSEASESSKTQLPVGLERFEVIYLRTTLDNSPKLQLKVNGTVPALSKVSYDRRTIVPILSMVSPTEGNVVGGAQIKLSGYGLLQPLAVTIGDKSVDILPFGVTENQFFVTTPAVSEEGVVAITATSSSNLSSNAINFAYGSTCDSVGFTAEDIIQPNGNGVDFLRLATTIAIGHDQRLYIALLGGTVHVVSYDRMSMQTTSHCYSKELVDPEFSLNGNPSQRDILGITIDPRDDAIRPYVSSSTMFFYKRIDHDNAGAWRNGAVDRFKPGTDDSDPDICLVYDKRIVSGLPVSNHDHTINGLVFTNDGDLLIAVGGSTNMGLPGWRLGNYWESPLSAGVVIAKLSKPDFDGEIKYSAERPELAVQTSGDVEMYSGGLRNPFGVTMDALGQVFVTDSSCNCLYGNVAASCADFDAAAAAAWTIDSGDWPASADVPGEKCFTDSATRPDKIVILEKGKNFGHANLQRGGEECAWIDPFTNKDVHGNDAPSSYKKSVALVKSPATGIGVYAANHFCGALRTDVITTAFRAQPTFRVGVKNGVKTRGPDQLIDNGGIAFVENAHGELLIPRHNVRQLFMLKPKVSKKAGLYVSGVSPIRHGKNGGLSLTIGGFNFGVTPSVSVEGKDCAVTRSSDTEIKCTMPSHSGGTKKVTVSTVIGESETLNNAVLYMNV